MTVSLPIPATWKSVEMAKSDYPLLADEIDAMIEEKEIDFGVSGNDNHKN